MRNIVTTLCSLALLILLGTQAMATMLTPNGNPTGDRVASGPNGSSTLDPSPAIYVDNCPWLSPALAAQGFDADGLDNIAGNADDWTITYLDLAGSFTLDTYDAWVDSYPAGDIDGHAYSGKSLPNRGGAIFGLTYQPNIADGDPSGNDVHWINVYNTNNPSDFDIANGHNAGGGYYSTLDNDGNPAGNPFYDPIGTAGNDWFLDIPWDPLSPGYDTEFQTFIATGDLTAHTLTIYDGVWWGYETKPIPEPATVLLLGPGLGVLALLRKRRPKLSNSSQDSCLGFSV